MRLGLVWIEDVSYVVGRPPSPILVHHGSRTCVLEPWWTKMAAGSVHLAGAA